MGNAAQCAAEAPVKCGCITDDGEIDTSFLIKGVAERFDQCSPPGCEGVEDFLPERSVGLNDKECADISLVRAVMSGDLDEVIKALEKGASVDTQAELNIFMGAKVSKGLQGVTPLMRAASLGFQDIAKCLVRCRANPGRSDHRGWTALCYALAAGELGMQGVLLACADVLAERQICAAWKVRQQILDECEENVEDKDKVEAVRAAFEQGGALTRGFRNV
mmetsp:Transcript_61498/g.159703  ORF Transcript_61498/g.159703 Transcript_61498/m.159703 type:complete len:220 (+) Transcript_61498:71-730(+)